MDSQYFDHNATTPLHPAAREAWLEAADRHWHNPSSLYPAAGTAKIALEDARIALADQLDIEDETSIIFTGGATEANNACIANYARRNPEARCAVSAVEHPSVMAPARRHFGRRLVEIPVDEDALLDLDALEDILARDAPELVAVMAANNETGSIQPISAIAEACQGHGALLHCDASQWFGKSDISIIADITVASAHKFGGPKGVGFIKVSDEIDQLELLSGGPQEERRRAGTEDLAGIAAMCVALENCSFPTQQAAMRDAFEHALTERIPGTRALCCDAERLPNTSMVVMPAGKNLKWLTRLGRKGFSISTGSACSSGAESGSHVLAAMNLTAEAIDRALRISSGSDHRAQDWQALIEAMAEVCAGIAEQGR